MVQKHFFLNYPSKEILKMMQDDISSFGQQLKQKRKKAGLTQSQLAQRANYICTEAYISQLENNKYVGKKGEPMRPSVEIVDALAIALNWSVGEARVAAGWAPPVESPEHKNRLETLVENLKESVMRSGAGELEDERVQEKVFRNLQRIAETMIQDELEEQRQKSKKARKDAANV